MRTFYINEQKYTILLNDEQYYMFLGLKDYQQCLVIQKMIELKNHPVQIHFCDTVREPNGLAMSSRNKRLTPVESENASILFSVLNTFKQKYLTTPIDDLLTDAKSSIEHKGFIIDYLTLTNNKLQELKTTTSAEQPVVLVAATLNHVRLIDNIALS
jgi:pantoate--beta-alanine ligase